MLKRNKTIFGKSFYTATITYGLDFNNISIFTRYRATLFRFLLRYHHCIFPFMHQM